MNSKIIVLIIAGVLIGGSILLIYKDNEESAPEFDKTGEWYATYDEIGRFNSDTGGTITSSTHHETEKAHLFIVDDIQKGSFSGSIDGVSVIGGLMDESLCFEVIDESKGYYCHVEGAFKGMTLSMQLVFHEDETFDDVTGGMYIFYVHEDMEGSPSMPEYIELDTLTCTNGMGKFYSIDANNELVSHSYAPGFTVGKQSKYIAIMQTQQMGKTVDEICILKDNHNGVLSYVLGGDIDLEVGTTSYFGGMSIADGKLDKHLNCRFFGDAHSIMYATSQFNVDYSHGKISERADISGKWVATVYDYDGKDVKESMSDVVKDITVLDSAFASVEVSTHGGQVSKFSWIGGVVGNSIFLIAEHYGSYFPLFGHVSGDKMYLCGYMVVDTGYIGLSIELTRSS